MKTIIISLTLLFMPISLVNSAPADWGEQTWTEVNTRYSIYRKDYVYGDSFLIDDSRDGKQNYEARALSIFRAADGGVLLNNQPVVFFIHGGGWTTGYRDHYSYMALSLTGDKGWVTVVIDYRLTANEVTLAGTTEKAAWWPDNIEDVADAYYWTVNHIADNGGDPNNIFDFGQSAGAHLALMLAVDPSYQSLRSGIKGVVAMSPPYDLKNLDKIYYCPILNPTFHGGCFNNQSELDNASPSTKIQAGVVFPPIYALYCQGELPSLADQCQELLAKLRSLNLTSYGDYLDEYNHASEIAAFSTATAEPVILVTNYIERLLQTVPADFNGDGSSDVALFRPATGLWAIRGVSRYYFGGSDDSPVCGDFNGDGTSDGGIFRKGSGLWAIRGVTRAYFGGPSDQAVPGDYDGDGSADIALFRPSTGLWAIRGVTRVYFGSSGDSPVPGNYAGSGEKDIAVFRPSSGLWAMRNISRIYFGAAGDSPVPGDYDWNGTWEAGIFRPASGLWAVRDATRAYFGSSDDLPVGADYSGKLLNSIGIFRPASGLWGIRGITRVYFGNSGDLPLPR